jgi:hypothetical protein
MGKKFTVNSSKLKVSEYGKKIYRRGKNENRRVRGDVWANTY